MIRRNALFSENAKKYDILDRIRYRVGGLSSELGDLVRRVISSRQISSNILKNLGAFVRILFLFYFYFLSFIEFFYICYVTFFDVSLCYVMLFCVMLCYVI
jgi:hypothetical protein